MLPYLLCWLTLYIPFRVILSRHSQSLYEELAVWFVSGEAAALRSNILSFTSLIQISTIQATSMESPSMQEIVSERFRMVQVECLHTVLFPKTLYRPTIRCRQVCRPSHTLKAPGVVLLYCSVKFWYLQGNWFLVMCVLCLSGAGWS